MKKRLMKLFAFAGMVSLAAMSFAGCGSKSNRVETTESIGEIETETRAEYTPSLGSKFEGREAKATTHMLETVYTKVDSKKLTATSIEELFTSNEEALIGDLMSYQPVCEVTGEEDAYFVFVDPETVNGIPAKLVDFVVYSKDPTKASTDGVEFDPKTGIVTIPKRLCQEDETENLNIGVNLMMAIETEDASGTEITE